MSKSVQKPERFDTVRVAGACAILYSLLVVGAVVVWGPTGLLETTLAADAFPLMVSERTAALAGCWLLVLAPLPLAMAGIGFFQVLGDSGSWMRTAVAAFTAGVVFAFLRNVLWVAMAYVMAPAYVEASASAQSTLLVVGDTLLRFGTIIGDVTGGFLIGVAILLFSLAILRTRRAPRWIAWLGIVVGASALLQPLMAFFEELMIIALLTAPGMLVWMVALGISLLRRPVSPVTTQTAPGPAAADAA